MKRVAQDPGARASAIKMLLRCSLLHSERNVRWTADCATGVVARRDRWLRVVTLDNRQSVLRRRAWSR
jgi:hypothetical protein